MERNKKKILKVYMLELVSFAISLGGEAARLIESMSDDELAEYICDIPEVELVVG